MTGFTYYDAKVRLGNNTLYEVLKQAVTPAEIEVLRVIHGDTAVSILAVSAMQPQYTAVDDNGNVRPIKHTSAYEKSRLHEIYGVALQNLESPTSIKNLFRGDLPTVFEETIAAPVEFADEVEFADDQSFSETAEEDLI
jgi:hypothetical protein